MIHPQGNGRWDCHIHMVLDGGYWKDAMGRHREQPDEAFVRATLAAYRDGGYTRLRDGGDALGAGLMAKQLAAEYGIDYRSPVFPIHKKGHYGGFIGRGFDTWQEYCALLQEAKTLGADFIKVMISGLMDFDHYGVLTEDPLEPGLIRDMIVAAHDLGFAVMAHANGDGAVQPALAAGVDSIEHGAYLSDETLCQLAESGAVWVPTLVTIGNLVGEGRFPDQAVKPLLSYQMQSVGKAARLGAKIAPGSDAGAYQVFHGLGGRQEWDLLSKAIGDGAEEILMRGAEDIFERFE